MINAFELLRNSERVVKRFSCARFIWNDVTSNVDPSTYMRGLKFDDWPNLEI